MAKRRSIDNVEIISISPEGRGVAKPEGKTIFVENALPDEIVNIDVVRKRKNYDEAIAKEVSKASPDRISPKCEFFTVCGGCSMQHLSSDRQIQYKQQFLLQHIEQQAGITPQQVLPPLQAATWHYRRKARLGVKYVKNKQRVLVGFREKKSSFLADIRQCEVLHKNIGYRLEELSKLIGRLSAFKSIPQIEVAVTNDTTALIIRHLEPLTETDLDIVTSYAKQNDLVIYLQPKGPDSVKLLYPEIVELSYSLPDHDLRYYFGPSDFTQVNFELNEKLVNRALELLSLNETDHVLDLFCGLGNFTLPIAKLAGSVVGVEGSKQLIEQARENARLNSISNAEFYTADLSKPVTDEIWFKNKTYNTLLIDPPRSGAKEFIETMLSLDANRIVYVSCNPATLARDISLLVNSGYKLEAAGVLDMFPQTSHVESIALLVKT